jgi:ABC-type Fe3+/spermidine/putrescine transport system ATPase subunit
MNEPSLPAVELRDIRKSYGERTVLDDVSLSIRPGEFFALLGPSGSGKSTLLKMVSGIETPDTGEVWLGGKNVTRVPPYRRRVHTVFQNYAIFPHLDVAGNVAFPLKVGGVPKAQRPERIRRALAWVQMDQHASRRVTELSGGERQRIALARALVDEPECVLLDEPLSALDPHLRVATLELLRDIQARLGATYLYVTHDREEALRAAHRVGVMHDGRLLQVGSPEEIYGRPSCPFVAGFVGPMNWLDGAVIRKNPDHFIALEQGVEIPCPVPIPAGTERVLVGVRPECIRLGEGPLWADVTNRQFSGATVSLQLKLSEQTLCIADVGAETDPPQVGERVQISWSPSSVHIFLADSSVPKSRSLAPRIDSGLAETHAATNGRLR